MRILIISHEYPPIGGGGANACMNLAKQFALAGHDTDIITIWFAGLKEKETIQYPSANIQMLRLKARRKYKEHCSFSEMLDFMRKAIKEADFRIRKALSSGEPYNICQVFFGIPSGPVGYYLKKKYKIPYVIRFGGGDIPGFQERFKKIYKAIAPGIKKIWKNADALVANSDGLRKLAYEFCSKYPIEVFYNGVDTDTFFPNDHYQPKENHINLLFISRLIERKGLQFVIPKITEIEEKTGKEIHLTIVGDGDFREKLEELVQENRVKEKVFFVGQKNKDELLPYYQNGDIFIFPSLKEGMPNAVLEAMACGLPIVMSPCQGSEELIDHNGLIAQKDPHQFFEAIAEILQLPFDEIKEMGRISRKRAETNFSWKNTANQYMDMFHKILHRKAE